MALRQVRHLAGVLIEQVEQIRDAVWLWARPRAQVAVCTGCGQDSARVHSGYERRLVDAALAGRRVVIRLRVRRFICRNDDPCWAGCRAIGPAETAALECAARTQNSGTPIRSGGRAPVRSGDRRGGRPGAGGLSVRRVTLATQTRCV